MSGEGKEMSGSKNELDLFLDRINSVVKKKNWKKDWSSGGCYIFLEVAEFIESLRGKGDSPPSEEAADVLFALFAVLGAEKIEIREVLNQLDKKIAMFE